MAFAYGSPFVSGASPKWEKAGWLLGLCAPLASFALYLKLTRILAQNRVLDPRSVADLFRSDLAMQASFAALAFALTFSVAAGRWRMLVRLGLQTLAVLYALLLMASHGYFMTSGTSLDYPLLAFSLLHIDETAKVISSAGSTDRVLLLAATLLAILTLPWLFSRQRTARAPAARLSARIGCFTLGGAISLTCLAVAIGARTRGGVEIARDPLLNVLVTYVSTTEADMASMGRASTHPRGATRLTATKAHPKNVVIVLLESTGMWATSMAGAHQTTPFLAELWQQSVHADRMYAVVPHTSKALVATLCGMDPRPGVGVPEASKGGLRGRCLPELLREQGYATGMMQSATREFEGRAQLASNMGFQTFMSGDEMDATGLEQANYFGYEDRILLKPVRTWLRRREASRPFLLTLLTNTPHHDYRTPHHYGSERFVSEPVRDRYLNSVRYQDFVLREIFQAFEDAGVAKDTIFIVLGDHGEGLGQHQRQAHDDMIYEEGLRIPLLIYEPGSERKPGELAGPFNELDIAPTVLDMLGMQVTEGRYMGRSVFAPNRPRVLYAACYNDFKCIARFEGSRKLIDFFERQAPALYDVVKDPGEHNDLSLLQSAEVVRARRDLRAWYGTVRAIYQDVVDRSVHQFVSFTRPSPQHARAIRFGDYIDLVGVSSTKEVAEPGGWVSLTYTFYVRQELPEGYRLIVRGYDGDKLYRWDHIPVHKLWPETKWRPGQYVSDEHRIRVPEQWRGTQLVVRGGFSNNGGHRLIASPASEDDAPVFIELPVHRR